MDSNLSLITADAIGRTSDFWFTDHGFESWPGTTA